MKNKRKYTDEELIARVWDVEEIRKLIYKRGFYITNEWRARELDELWVTEDEHRRTASFGRNTGWYVGMNAIRAYYVDKHLADRRAQLKMLHEADPSVAVSDENLHLGSICHHSPTTGVVRLAGDGKTAKAIFYSIAEETDPLPDGTAEALWVPEKQAYDLIRETGGWKIWHVVIATDLFCEAGTDFAEYSPYANYAEHPVMKEFGTPTIPCVTHDSTFNWFDDYPPVPQDYDTFTDDISYGPEGYHPPAVKHLQFGEGRNYQ